MLKWNEPGVLSLPDHPLDGCKVLVLCTSAQENRYIVRILEEKAGYIGGQEIIIHKGHIKQKS